MKLYHFTSPERLPFIKEDGIWKGDVPITIAGGYNAPWFTSDPNPGNQDWSGGWKSEMRLTVNIPDGDSNLQKWTDVTQEEIDKQLNEEAKESLKQWYDILNKTGGGGADNWYIYRGVVPSDWIEQDELV